MKRNLFLMIMVLTIVGTASAQQFAKTAVVSLSRIYGQFYKESKGVKEFEDLKNGIKKEIDRRRQEILTLNSQKQEAAGNGDSSKAQELDQIIQKKQDEFKDYGRQQQDILRQKSEEVKNDLSFQKQVIEEIEQERISKGFNIVLNADDPVVVNYGLDADITDGVIARLNALATPSKQN